MATVGSQLLKLFGLQRAKPLGRSHVRTLSNPTQWEELREAFSGYSGGYSSRALRVSVVYACIERRSNDLASMPFRPMRKTAKGYEIADDHDQYFIDGYPSPLYSRFQFFKVLEAHRIHKGNGYAEITRVNGRPVAYTILHPSKVELSIVNGSIYWIYSQEGEKKRVISDDDMIHGVGYSEDGIVGIPFERYAKDTISLALNANNLSSSLYENQMWSPGYISYRDELGKEQMDMISDSWSHMTGEAGKEFIPVLDRGSEFKHFGMSLKDAEYSNTMQNADIQLCRYLGVAPSLIGIRDGANVSYNSLEQDNIAYVQNTLLPAAIMWEKEFERKALRESEEGTIRFKFELKSRLRGDMAARSTFYQMALNTGLLSINDTLKLEDMDTIGPEGDERYINSALVPLSQLGKEKPEDKPEDKNDDAVKDLMKSITKNGNGHAVKAGLQ